MRMEPPRQSVPPPIQPKGFFTGVQIRPIISGAVVDYVGTFVGTALYIGFFYMGDALEENGSPEKAIEDAFQQMISSPEGLLTLFLIGILGTVLGGYVAGRLAKAEEVKHGALVGAVAVVLGLLQSSMGDPSPVPPWYELLGYILTIPAGALGGSIDEGRAKRSTREADQGPRGFGS